MKKNYYRGFAKFAGPLLFVVNGEPALEIDTHVHGPVFVVGDFRGLGGGAPEVSGRLVVANWEI